MTDPSLAPTRFIDSDHPDIIAFAARHAGDGDVRSRAVALATAVRDAVPYSVYTFDIAPDILTASQVLRAEKSFCVPKAVLLAAVARAAGIPSRVGFADVRNHLAPARFEQLMDTPDFNWHAYTALLIDGRWLKATPAFDLALCTRNEVEPLAFDGMQDSIFQPYDAQGRRSMEYLRFHGEFDDLPYERFAAEMQQTYPRLLATLAAERAARAAAAPPATGPVRT